MPQQITTSLTTRDVAVRQTNQNVIYESGPFRGSTYVVTPHPPTPRDKR